MSRSLTAAVRTSRVNAQRDIYIYIFACLYAYNMVCLTQCPTTLVVCQRFKIYTSLTMSDMPRNPNWVMKSLRIIFLVSLQTGIVGIFAAAQGHRWILIHLYTVRVAGPEAKPKQNYCSTWLINSLIRSPFPFDNSAPFPYSEWVVYGRY
jgi:hypothetical protein